MAEAAKVRFVRCPKCENLLPELEHYSVYLCGGCGAVLRANVGADTLSQKSDEERVQGVSEKLYEKSDNLKFSEKRMNMSDEPESDVKSYGSSSGRAGSREVLSNIDDKERNDSSIEADKCIVTNNLEMNEKLDESGLLEMGKEFEELKPPNCIANGPRRSEQIGDWRSREEGGVSEGFWRNPRRDVQGMRYSEEGSSNFHLRSSYGYGDQLLKNQTKPDELNKVEELQQERAELLRKLDELKDQISGSCDVKGKPNEMVPLDGVLSRKLDELKDQLTRSCDVNDKPKEKGPLDAGLVHQEEPYGDSKNWCPHGSWGSNRASVQYPMPDTYVARPRYVSYYPEPSPYCTSRHEMDMHRFYPSIYNPNQVQRFGDPLSSQMLRRDPQQACGFQQQPSHPYFSRQYLNDDMVPFEPYPPHANLHLSSCSCFHCYNRPMFYHHGNPDAFGPRDYSPEITNLLPLNSHNPQSHTRWPGDLNSEVGGYVCKCPPTVALATGGQRCSPVAGGAPFVTCYNCFELLQLPKKISLVEKKQLEVRCGACSSVILLAVENKKLVVSVHAKETLETVEDSLNTTASGCNSNSHMHSNRATMNFSSGDYDNSGYDFQSLDKENISRKSKEIESIHSISPYSSEDENSPESLNAQGKESNSTELETKFNLFPPSASSLPLEDCNHNSKEYHAINGCESGNQSGRYEWEKGKLKKSTSLKDASLATEMEESLNSYSNTGKSQESGDGTREEDHRPRVTKGGPSFFAGIFQKSFRDFSRSNHTIELSAINVTINGRPIPDKLLKKAEKLSGPIRPGQYWYDFQAGFWGVMGGPCLGIIPPFIEEFNHPMPDNCAGGNTGVFVNGRELHQKDLDLLSSRGLPTTKDRSYVIEISGRVLDKDSGEELDSLGKLARTVEKFKRGFGMKVPRAAASVG